MGIADAIGDNMNTLGSIEYQLDRAIRNNDGVISAIFNKSECILLKRVIAFKREYEIQMRRMYADLDGDETALIELDELLDKASPAANPG